MEGTHINADQYNVCLTVFFVTYVTFEVPANMLLKKFNPSVWSPFSPHSLVVLRH